MSIRHEQLKKNVEISRERLDRTRKQQKVWRNRHALSRKFTVASISAWTFTLTIGVLSSPTWLLLIFMFVFAVCFGVCLRGMTDAKEGIKRWRDTEISSLSKVTEDIQALVERETLQLMDPQAYARIEREYEEAQRKKQELHTYRKKASRYKYQNYYSDHTHFYWTELQDNGSILYKRKKFMGDDEEVVSRIW